MQRSNFYIIGFAAILTIVCGGLLAFANQGLKERQNKEKTLDTRKKILGAVMDIEGKSGDDINSIFEAQINGRIVNSKGDVTSEDTKEAEKVDPKKVYKTPNVEDKKFPVFEYSKDGKVVAYIFPVFGKGLWDDIWGYMALEGDLNTVKGVVFDHKGETPGLGARITEKEVQQRFVGKEIMDGGIEMIKGEGVPSNITEPKHEVDGLSGATMTTKGVNAMLDAYIGYYKPYFEKQR